MAHSVEMFSCHRDWYNLQIVCLRCCSAGVIQPTKISDDGKPVPVEHVAELLEGLQATEQQNPPQSDSD